MALLVENMDLTETPGVITGPISLSWFTMTLTQSVEKGIELIWFIPASVGGPNPPITKRSVCFVSGEGKESGSQG